MCCVSPQLLSSFDADRVPNPEGMTLSDDEKLVQGVQVMQIMSVKIQNKYGMEIFKVCAAHSD